MAVPARPRADLKAAKYAGTERPRLRRQEHRADLREDLDPHPVRLRGGRLRPGRPRHLPRPDRVADGPQGVGRGHRPGAGPDVRRHRVPRLRRRPPSRSSPQYSGVPVWNGLTDEWHPTQTLVRHAHDAGALGQARPARSPSPTAATPGNNVGNSLLVAGAMMGMDVRIVAPEVAVEPRRGRREAAQASREVTGARITPHRGPGARASAASTSCTPTSGSPWASRRRSGTSGSTQLLPYQVNMDAARARPATRTSSSCTACRRSTTANTDGRPAGLRADRAWTALEVTDEVFESPALDRLRPGREPAAHDQGGHGRHAGRLSRHADRRRARRQRAAASAGRADDARRSSGQRGRPVARAGAGRGRSTSWW